MGWLLGCTRAEVYGVGFLGKAARPYEGLGYSVKVFLGKAARLTGAARLAPHTSLLENMELHIIRAFPAEIRAT